MDEETEFDDLLTALGASSGPPLPADQLAFKDLEIAELQRNLAGLRGMGEGLAGLERDHLTQRAELEAQVAELERELARLAPLQDELAHTCEALRAWQSHAEQLALQATAAQAAAPAPPEAGEPDAQSTDRAGENERLARRLESLRQRHKRLEARWRALPADSRDAGAELARAREQAATATQALTRLEREVARQERQLARQSRACEREQERLARARQDAAAQRERAREHRERSLARAARLREVESLAKEQARELAALRAQMESVGERVRSLVPGPEASQSSPLGKSLAELMALVQPAGRKREPKSDRPVAR